MKSKTQDKIKEYEKKIEELKAKLQEERNRDKTIVIDGWEYETKEHHFNKTLKEIKIPNGWKLWSFEDCIKFHNDEKLREKLNLDNCWFFIKQPFKFNKGYVARFYAFSEDSGLYCGRNPSYRSDSLGVRFKRKVEKK